MSDAYTTASSLISGTSAITTIVGTRYWPDRRESDDLPAIMYQLIAENRHDHLSAPGKGKRIRIQFNSYARTNKQAQQIADLIEAAASLTGRVIFRQSTYDSDVQIYYAQLDWSVLIDSPS